MKQRLEDEDHKYGEGDLKIFLDKTDLQPMDTWPHVLRKRLRQAEILLACISRNYYQEAETVLSNLLRIDPANQSWLSR